MSLIRTLPNIHLSYRTTQGKARSLSRPATSVNAILGPSFSHFYRRPITSGPIFRPDAVLSPGSSSFAQMAADSQFVDKSGALADFLATKRPIHLLLRPRRSGKTTLLRMFRAFFERTGDAQRKELFTKNGLAITHHPKFESEFGQYPVLYVDFSNVIGSTMGRLLQQYKARVIEIASNLEDSGVFRDLHELPKNQQTFLSELLTDTLPDSKWPASLFRLTKVLHTVHKKEVVLLVDEYDTPISHAAQYNYFPEANEFFRLVLSPLLKDNENLRGALVVGILRVAKAGLLSGVNNLEVFPLGASKDYSTACMFTEAETMSAYHRQNELSQNGLPFTLNDIQAWYNGYHTADGLKLFNPWSISKALTSMELRPYWIESGYDKIMEPQILKMLKADDHFRVQVVDLVAGNNIRVEVEEEVSYHSVTNLTVQQLWTLMLYAGYLTRAPISSALDGDGGASTVFIGADANAVKVSIPNNEIRSIFLRWIKTDLSQRLTPKLRGNSAILWRNLSRGSMASFAQDLRKVIFKSMPAQHFGSKEEIYQSYVKAYLESASEAEYSHPEWECGMEYAAGAGRLDLIFRREDAAIMFELKREKHEKKEGYGQLQRRILRRLAREAMDQCATRHYDAILPRHVTKLRIYGIGFLGPYCAVDGQLLERSTGGQVLVLC